MLVEKDPAIEKLRNHLNNVNKSRVWQETSKALFPESSPARVPLEELETESAEEGASMIEVQVLTGSVKRRRREIPASTRVLGALSRFSWR